LIALIIDAHPDDIRHPIGTILKDQLAS
jgi:hypothetical protein